MVNLINTITFSKLGAERTMTRFWKRAGVKEDKGIYIDRFEFWRSIIDISQI